jgi:hypothetical protein
VRIPEPIPPCGQRSGVAVTMTHPPSFIDILRNPDALTAVVGSIDILHLLSKSGVVDAIGFALTGTMHG